ncbi:MAG: AmmeMemoRadiSam system protein B [Candidatus Magasanikbacteria bacterium]|jgi:poly-gamma-glutamate synthesis protein (capsule biosynthesis protein)
MKKLFLIVCALVFLTGCNSPIVYDNLNNGPTLQKKTKGIVQTSIETYQIIPGGNESLYDRAFQNRLPAGDLGTIRGGIVPHHLVAGYIPATFFEYIGRQKPSTIVLFSPNHRRAGPGNIITGIVDWQTAYGVVNVDRNIISKLNDASVLKIDEKTMADEHGIYGLLPIIAKTNPSVKIVPILFDWDTPTSSIDALLAKLFPLLPRDTIFVGSVDFSHYQTWPVANFHDEYTRSVIRNFDFDHIWDTEIDSHPSVYALLRSMEHVGAQKIVNEINDNSASLFGRSDIPETTSYYSPWFTDGHRSTNSDMVSLLFFGDMMLDRSVKIRIDEHGPDWIFEKLAGGEGRFFTGTNFVHANLEGPFADSRRATTKTIAFRFDPFLIPTLKKYHFNIFTVANNHTLDMSAAGLQESLVNLDKANIDHYGDGYGIGKDAVIFKDVNGIRLAFVGFNDTYFRLKKDEIFSTIKDAKLKSTRVIVNIHWGDEYQEISNTNQRDLAHLMIDAGADIIIGHHPHVVQEMEIYKNRPIFYSLGNFVFDQYFSIPTQQGLAVGINLTTSTISAYVFPLQSAKSQISQMNYIDALRYLNEWQNKSRINSKAFSNFNITI